MKLTQLSPATKDFKTREEVIKPWIEKYGEEALPYLLEWVDGSAIAPELAVENLIPIAPNDPVIFDLLIPVLDFEAATGELKKKPEPGTYEYRSQLRKYRNRYPEWLNGSWYVAGLNPLTGEPADLLTKYTNTVVGQPWVIVKPNTPRTKTKESGKVDTVKYEMPLGTRTHPYFFKVPISIWKMICEVNCIPYPDFRRVQFWQWVADRNIPIWITEGVKKAGSLLSRGIVAIALPGIHAGFRTEEKGVLNEVDGEVIKETKKIRVLSPDLVPFTEKKRDFIICFDNDNPVLKPQTVKDVNRAALNLGELINQTNKKCPVKYAQIPTNDKGIDDFLARHKKSTAEFDRMADSAIKLKFFKKIAKKDPLVTLSLSDNDEIRYEKQLSPVSMEGADILLLKSAKGTGKTHQITEKVKQHKAKGGKVLVLSHRTQLGKHLCHRFEIPYKDSIKNTANMFDDSVGLCLDSLNETSTKIKNLLEHFTPEDNWLVILDESEQQLSHLVNSGTEIKKCRAEVIHNLNHIINAAVDSEFGGVILADADLTDVSGGYLRSTAPQARVKTIDNRYKPNDSRDIYLYADRYHCFAQLDKDLQKCLELKRAGVEHRRISILTQSQQAKSMISAKNIEKYVVRNYPELVNLVADSHTVADPDHPAFGIVEHINDFFEGNSQEAEFQKLVEQKIKQVEKEEGYTPEREKVETHLRIELAQKEELNPSPKVETPDVFIFTNVIETGVSIDKRGFFLKQYGFISGVTSVAASRQGLSRVREDCDRHVYCPQMALPCQTVGHRGLVWREGVIDFLTCKQQSEFYAAHYDGDSDISEHRKMQWMRSAVAPLELYGDFGARTNIEANRYWDCFVFGMQDEGRVTIVSEIDEFTSKMYRNRLRRNKKASYDAEIKTTLAQPKFDSQEDYEASKSTEQKTEATRLREKKHEVSAKYCKEVNEDLIRTDDNGYYPKLKRHYYLHHQEECQEHSRRKLRHEFGKMSQFNILTRDLTSGTYAAEVDLLNDLGIINFTQGIQEIEGLWEQWNAAKSLKKVHNSREKAIRAEIKSLKRDIDSIKAEAKALRESKKSAPKSEQISIAAKLKELKVSVNKLTEQREAKKSELKELLTVEIEEPADIREKLLAISLSNNDDFMQEMRDVAILNKEDILADMGITIPEQINVRDNNGNVTGYRPSTPVEALQGLLDKIGIQLYFFTKTGDGDSEKRHFIPMYQEMDSSGIQATFEKWEREEEERRQKQLQKNIPS